MCEEMQILLEWQSCIATAITTMILKLQSKLRICRQSIHNEVKMHIEIQKILETAAVTQEITPISIHNEAEYGMLKQVAVTGAGGFIASWIVKLLLQEGYHVQAAVCNLDNEVQKEHLKNMKGDKEWLELVKSDVLDYAAMLAAVDGMKVCSIGLFHTACPVTANITDPEDWYWFAKTKAEKAA
ncbi:unnamed protein product [Sphagnum troendelagicum]|uniref:NAD(P)-binding domain-containing protein n=1 Tax=Sphagnum troendelagicum TaxID=128251 RepID=A0ABP0UXG4_9BRYO